MSHRTFLGDKPVNAIGFGAMQLAGPGVFGPPRDRDAALAVLRRAVELGVDHIDTSQFYGPDVVNELIHEALHPYPDELRLVSKVGAERDEKGNWNPALEPEKLRAGVEANLRSLEIERLDLVNLRLGDEPSDIPLAEQIGELQSLRNEGKLDLIGLSNGSIDDLRAALELTELGEVQNAFSIFDRTDKDVLDLAREHEISYVPFFPLGSAFAGGPKALAEEPAVATVASRRDATPTQVALAWLLAQYDRMLLIPGTSSVDHLEENLAAGDLELTAEDLEELEKVEHRSVGTP